MLLWSTIKILRNLIVAAPSTRATNVYEPAYFSASEYSTTQRGIQPPTRN